MRLLRGMLVGSVMLLALGGIGCGRGEVVTARYWKAHPVPSEEARQFPELAVNDKAQRFARAATGKGSIGICFSGGGIRSASATLGQLRALRASGLLDRAAYISCVSGGSWAAVPYTFNRKYDLDTFFGTYTPPAGVSQLSLGRLDPNSLAGALTETEMPSWLEMLGRGILATVGLSDNDFFTKQLDKRLLAPFDLDGRDKFVALDETAVSDLLSQNPELAKAHRQKPQFLLPAEGRPFLIVNGTLRRYDIAPWKWNEAINKRMPLEMTPMYVGLPHRFMDVGEGDRAVGGVYVEPAAYAARRIEVLDGTRLKAHLEGGVGGGRRFNLADMIAISGSAPGEYGVLARAAFPRLYSASLDNLPGTKVDRYYHADGGLSENLGVMPLLARRVENLILFVNAEGRDVPSYVRELFGNRTTEWPGWNARGVFPAHQLADLELAMDRCREGGLPFHVDTYVVQPPAQNDSEDFFNLHLRPDDAPYKVNVAWFFLDSTAWMNELPQSTRDFIYASDDFKHFPRYKTFANRPFYIIDPTVTQVNALSNMTDWIVRTCAPQIEAHFGIEASTTGPARAAVQTPGHHSSFVASKTGPSVQARR